MKSIKNCINEEELLDICLDLCSLKEGAFEGAAGRVITMYVAKDLKVCAEEIADRVDEVSYGCQRLIAGKITNDLSLKGLIDVCYDDDVYLSISDTGIKFLERLYEIRGEK